MTTHQPEEAIVVSETLHYILCPHCLKGRSRICHLYGTKTSFGGWFCKECGNCFMGEVDGTRVTVKKVDNRKDNTTVFLKHGNLLIAVRGMAFGGILSEGSEYFYNEHTCPANYLSDVRQVYDLNTSEHDPHGIFRFLCEVPEMNDEELLEVKPIDIVDHYDGWSWL